MLTARCTHCRAFIRKSFSSSSNHKRIRLGYRRGFASSQSIKEILDMVAKGNIGTDEGEARVRAALAGFSSNNNSETHHSSQHQLDSFAKIDHGRSERTGFPEVIFAEGKTAAQVCAIMDDMAQYQQRLHEGETAANSVILATRVSAQLFEQMSQSPPSSEKDLIYDPKSRIARLETSSAGTAKDGNNSQPRHRVAVVTAGTTDISVAEEAAVVLEACRCAGGETIAVDRVYDAGVAGLHRILGALPRLRQAQCIIVCAGMDGALPSVVGGLVSCPVLAVPTSVGYGASFQGVSALLTMLNSCSPGVAVLNIDNGFGAAAMAYKILTTMDKRLEQ